MGPSRNQPRFVIDFEIPCLRQSVETVFATCGTGLIPNQFSIFIRSFNSFTASQTAPARERPELSGARSKTMNMEPLRFVHAADLHLDSPFRGVGDASASIKEKLQAATLGALRRVVAHTIESQSDFLVIAGDIYDSKDRNLRALVSFRKEMERLAERNIPVYL